MPIFCGSNWVGLQYFFFTYEMGKSEKSEDKVIACICKLMTLIGRKCKSRGFEDLNIFWAFLHTFFIPAFNVMKKRNRKWFCKFSLLWPNKFSPKFLAFMPYSFHAQWVKITFWRSILVILFEWDFSQYYQPVLLRIFWYCILLPKLFWSSVRTLFF